MKNNSNNGRFKHYLSVLLTFMSYFTNAQSDFRAGYVIDPKNDTLFGDINYRGDILMGEKCVFKSSSTGIITEYKPDDISAYRFKDDRFFIAKEINGKKVFLEFLIKGKVSIYYLRNNLTDRYFIEKEGEKLSELPYEEKIVYGEKDDRDRALRTSTMYLSTSKIHKSILKKYMKDAPELQSRIDKLAKPEHSELIKLAKDYHNVVCKDESCIIYKKKAARINVNLEIVGGVIKYGAAETYVIKENYNRFGLLAHFRLPRVNEKLYLRTGLIYSRLKIPVYSSSPTNEITDFNFFKIPLQLEYIYPKGRIKPVFAYGFSLFSFATVDFMAGLNVQVSEKIALGLNYEADFIPNAYLVVVPSTFSSQSALVGLKIKL
jgi:hypothetical protein